MVAVTVRPQAEGVAAGQSEAGIVMYYNMLIS